MIKHTILLAEDEIEIAENIIARLEVEGYTVIYAEDGKKAVDAAVNVKPHVILLDAMLPRIDGFEVCKILKKNPHTNHIPILFLTSLNAVGDVEKAMSAGADDYLTKPFEYNRLLAKISRYLPHA
ncbi:MAG: response regulator [bacterium]